MPFETHSVFEKFLFTHEYLFRQLTSRYYPLSFALIEKHADMWDMLSLYCNTGVAWDLKTVAQYENNMHWYAISNNKGVRWTDTLLDRYADQLIWFRVSESPFLPFTDAFMEKYAGRLVWKNLSSNSALPLTDTFLDRYEDKINWQVFKGHHGIPEGLSLKYREKLDSILEVEYIGNRVNPDRVGDYLKRDYRNTKYLPKGLQEMLEEPVSHFSEDFFDTYAEYLDWAEIGSCVHLEWDISFYERFYTHLGKEPTYNPAFYNLVLQPHINDEVIEKVLARLNPKDVVKFYYLEENAPANLRIIDPSAGNTETELAVAEQIRMFFTEQDLQKPFPCTQFNLSIYRRHPIWFADVHTFIFNTLFPAMVVSEKLKNILERFTLPPHRFYEIELAITDATFGTDSRTYYVFYVPEQEYLYFDYDKTVFVEDEDRQEGRNASLFHKSYYLASYFTRQIAPEYPILIQSPEAFLEAKKELQERDPAKKLRPQEYIWQAGFDLISSSAENPRNHIWVSEDLKKAMENAAITGLQFERVLECRPRMQGLETPEHRTKNAAVLAGLQNAFKNIPSWEDQITVRNFRKAEAWAQEVLANAGVVKRMFAEHSPAPTDDDFMNAVRKREEELDVIFPDWFIDILKTGQLPAGLEDYTLLPLESICRSQTPSVSEFPIAVKSVTFASYQTHDLFLVLKKDSYYELDDVIYGIEYDEGPAPEVIMRMKPAIQQDQQNG